MTDTQANPNLIDHYLYTTLALRTENTPKSLVVDSRMFFGSLQAAIAMSELMDVMKKHFIYGKSIDSDKVHRILSEIRDHLSTFQDGIEDKVTHEAIIDGRLREFHAALGLFTESGEALTALLNTFAYGHKFDEVNFAEEIGGDVSWYQALGLDAVQQPLSVALGRNIAKLEARYKGKFSAQAALNRDTATERKILEGADTAAAAAVATLYDKVKPFDSVGMSESDPLDARNSGYKMPITTHSAVGEDGATKTAFVDFRPGEVHVDAAAEGNLAYSAARKSSVKKIG